MHLIKTRYLPKAPKCHPPHLLLQAGKLDCTTKLERWGNIIIIYSPQFKPLFELVSCPNSVSLADNLYEYRTSVFVFFGGEGIVCFFETNKSSGLAHHIQIRKWGKWCGRGLIVCRPEAILDLAFHSCLHHELWTKTGQSCNTAPPTTTTLDFCPSSEFVPLLTVTAGLADSLCGSTWLDHALPRLALNAALPAKCVLAWCAYWSGSLLIGQSSNLPEREREIGIVSREAVNRQKPSFSHPQAEKQNKHDSVKQNLFLISLISYSPPPCINISATKSAVLFQLRQTAW